MLLNIFKYKAISKMLVFLCLGSFAFPCGSALYAQESDRSEEQAGKPEEEQPDTLLKQTPSHGDLIDEGEFGNRTSAPSPILGFLKDKAGDLHATNDLQPLRPEGPNPGGWKTGGGLSQSNLGRQRYAEQASLQRSLLLHPTLRRVHGLQEDDIAKIGNRRDVEDHKAIRKRNRVFLTCSGDGW